MYICRNSSGCRTEYLQGSISSWYRCSGRRIAEYGLGYTNLPFVSKVSVLLASDLQQDMQNTELKHQLLLFYYI